MKDEKGRIIVRNVVLFIVCVLVNFLGRKLADVGHLPVWLDCVGTYIAAVLASPLVTVLVAVIGQIFVSLENPTSLLYVIPAVVIALGLIYCRRKKYTDSLYKMVIVSFITGILCVIISTPLNLMFKEGYAGNIWGDALVDMLTWYDYPLVVAAVAGEAVVEIIDKQICFVLGYIVVYLIRRAGKNRKTAEKAVTAMVVLSLLAASFSVADFAFADEDKKDSIRNYISTVYDNTSGMMSSEANTLVQTADGCIWIGSYAGLTKYDGNEFEFVHESGIVNVTALFCDASGRLWIGTNDGGVARYEAGEFTFFTVEDGLADNGIRAIVQDDAGYIYVGTMDCISRFDSEDNITTIHEEITYVRSMITVGEDLIVADNNGSLYILSGDETLAEYDIKSTGIFFECAANTSDGILAGTSDGDIYNISIDGTKVSLEKTDLEVNEGINQITQKEDGLTWICTENGYGYLDADGQYVNIAGDNEGISFETVIEDYQGNIWLTSTRLGVVKLSESKFTNLFELYGLESAVVNAVTVYQNQYYVGTDTGLVVFDKEGEAVENNLTDMLSTSRIRCLMVDSVGQLWICVYGDDGLVRYDFDGNITTFNMENAGMTSDRMRCTLETSDGTIVVGTADGINFIEDNEVVATIEEDLPNTQILCLLETDDGTVLAGSDGGGIYVIEDNQVTDIYNVDDGLSSDVILRITEYEDGYFIVTSNSLCYMEAIGDFFVLENFPYYNNYDVIIEDDTAYVLSSAGIYIADADELASDKEINYELLNSSEGLLAGLTANSWCYTDPEKKIYLCTNSGVVLYDDTLGTEDSEYKFGLASIECDGEEIYVDLSGDTTISLPLDAKNVTLRATVYNYALQDVKVKFYLEGMDNGEEPVSYQDVETVQISSVTHGSYKVILQIYDSSGTELLQEKTYVVEKETQMWEEGWYKAYLIIVCMELMCFVIWMIISVYYISKKKTELEEIRRELEEKVEEQIKEIKDKEAHEMNMIRRVIMALSDTVDAKDRYTSGHSKRVAEYARAIAKRLGKSEDELQEIYYAGLLHDVGKIRVPEEVINKPGKLTDEEYDLIKIHPVTSYHILKDISEDSDIALGAKFHHERYDGKGYPNGLSGMDIPEIARIIAVADAYDAMASNRSYRAALPQAVVREQIVQGKGTQFDPEFADIMLAMIDEDVNYTMKESKSDTKNILVVGDDTENTANIKAVLEGEDMYNVFVVADSDGILTALKEDKIDMVLLDLDMKRVDGFEAFSTIRKDYRIPVVFMSTNREFKNLKRAADMGVSDYMTKPFTDISLKEVVHNIMWL